jgi:FMN phosphatase YigB (HAD superfamily)
VIKAVLFDFGGTLYDYRCLAAAEAESLVELARQAGAKEEPPDIMLAQRDAMRRVFREYLPRSFYMLARPAGSNQIGRPRRSHAFRPTVYSLRSPAWKSDRAPSSMLR